MRCLIRTSGAFRRPVRGFGFSTQTPGIDKATEVKSTFRTPQVLKLADEILALNMLEVVELQNVLAERTGVDVNALRAAPVAAAAAPATASAGAGADKKDGAGKEKEAKKEEAAPKKDTFTLKITAIAEGKKFPVLKVVRKVAPGMNLMDSKKLVEELPSVVSNSVPAADAEKFVAELKEAGATAELV